MLHTNGTGPSPGLYAMLNKYMPAMISLVLVKSDSVSMNEIALSNWNNARSGNVTSSRFLRPNVSMV